MKLLKLFICLLIIILIGVVTLNRVEDEKPLIQNSPNLGDREALYNPNGLYLTTQTNFVERADKGVYRVLVSQKEEELEGKEYYRHLIEQYNWNTDVAWAVMREESNFNPNAVNTEGHRGCNGSYGLMQIACVHFGKYGINWDNWDNPEVNIHAAYLIWKDQGWKPWGVCHYQNGVRKVRCWL